MTDLAAEVLGVLRRAVYTEPEVLDVLATYVGLAHLAPHGTFFTVPYISLEGPAGSGKSTTGRVMALLGGGALSSGLTPASLFRLVDEQRGVLLVLDEGDGVLRGARREAFSNLLLEGDHWAAVVDRVEDRVVRSFKIFSPKVVVSIRGVDISALRRRVIPLRMEPAPLSFTSRWDLDAIRAVRKEVEARAEGAHADVEASVARYLGQADGFVSQAHRAAWAPLLATGEALGIDLTDVCRAHGELLEQTLDLSLCDALREVLRDLPEGRYRLSDLRTRLLARYGVRAEMWNEERIGRQLRASGLDVRRDGRGRYVEIRRGVRGVVSGLRRRLFAGYGLAIVNPGKGVGDS